MLVVTVLSAMIRLSTAVSSLSCAQRKSACGGMCKGGTEEERRKGKQRRARRREIEQRGWRGEWRACRPQFHFLVLIIPLQVRRNGFGDQYRERSEEFPSCGGPFNIDGTFSSSPISFPPLFALLLQVSRATPSPVFVSLSTNVILSHCVGLSRCHSLTHSLTPAFLHMKPKGYQCGTCH